MNAEKENPKRFVLDMDVSNFDAGDFRCAFADDHWHERGRWFGDREKATFLETIGVIAVMKSWDINLWMSLDIKIFWKPEERIEP